MYANIDEILNQSFGNPDKSDQNSENLICYREFSVINLS